MVWGAAKEGGDHTLTENSGYVLQSRCSESIKLENIRKNKSVSFSVGLKWCSFEHFTSYLLT